jgi:hypothetical protein
VRVRATGIGVRGAIGAADEPKGTGIWSVRTDPASVATCPTGWPETGAETPVGIARSTNAAATNENIVTTFEPRRISISKVGCP